MDAVTYRQARENLAEIMRRVCEDHAPVVITKRKQIPVVIISLDDWNAIAETAYLLRSPANAGHLRASIAYDKAGEVAAHDLAAGE